MQHTQINCNKKKTEIADYKIKKTKKINIKLKLCCCSIKKMYNKVYKTILITIKNCLNNDIIKKKRK